MGSPPESGIPAGVWGCARTHLRIWEDTLSLGKQSVLVFEDDAIFCKDFNKRLEHFLEEVPDDWHQLYFGGEHMIHRSGVPVLIKESVVQGRDVNRTHAYAIRQPMLSDVYYNLVWKEWKIESPRDFHIDHQLGRIHQTGKWNVYCAHPWLVGQAEGISQVKGRPVKEMWFNNYPVRRDA